MKSTNVQHTKPEFCGTRILNNHKNYNSYFDIMHSKVVSKYITIKWNSNKEQVLVIVLNTESA